MNQRQVRFLEFLASYDLDISYALGKANVVVDALSRKKALLCQLVVSSSPLLDQIMAKQDEDEMLRLMKESVRSRVGGSSGAQIDDKGILRTNGFRINGRICVPNVDGLRQELLQENHRSMLFIHPGVSKMY